LSRTRDDPTDIKRVQLLVDTRMVDNQDDVDELEDEFEDYESLKDRLRRGPLLGVLLGTTLVAGATWVVLNAIFDIRFSRGFADFFASEATAEMWIWVQTARGIAYSVFLVALGSYVVLWLALREDSS
jgi:hypothetical protein